MDIPLLLIAFVIGAGCGIAATAFLMSRDDGGRETNRGGGPGEE